MTTILFACVHNAGRSQMAACVSSSLQKGGGSAKRESLFKNVRYDAEAEEELLPLLMTTTAAATP